MKKTKEIKEENPIEKILEFQIWANYKEGSIGYDIEDKLLHEESLIVSGERIIIKEYQVKTSHKFRWNCSKINC